MRRDPRRDAGALLALAGLLLWSSSVQAAIAPVYDYCTGEGYQVDGEHCVLPDSSRCELWAFFYGNCGQQFTRCEKNGGKISADGDPYCTLVYADSCALCTLPNQEKCPEVLVTAAGKCQRPSDGGLGLDRGAPDGAAADGPMAPAAAPSSGCSWSPAQPLPTRGEVLLVALLSSMMALVMRRKPTRGRS